MRNLFLLLLTGMVGLAASASPCRAQIIEEKKADEPQRSLADLLKAVKQTDDVEARISAIVALAEFGPKAAPALADLLDALQTKNEDMRLNAAITLAKIGKSAIPPVAKLLQSDDIDTKFYAIWTIGWIGPEAKATVPTLIKLMNDKNEGIRRKAAFALGRLAGDPDKTIGVLVEAFNDESDEVRQSAGDALAKFGKVAVAPLMGLLKSENPKAQVQASVSLGDIGSEAKDAVPMLKELFLAKSNTGANHHYAQILAKIGKAGLPALEIGFKDSRPEVRQAAAQAMTTLGADAVGILVDGLGSKDVEVRRLAAQTLSPMRIGDKSVVIALAFALADEDNAVRQISMQALSQLGPQAKLAAPRLKIALVDLDPNVRQQSYFLLQQIGDDPRPALTKALESKDAKVRINTASLMVTVNFDREKAMPVLVDALKDEDLGLRMQAAFTLAQNRLHPDKITPIFIEGLKHNSSSVRLQGVQGLSMFGNTGNNAAALALVELLRDPDQGVRQQSIYALHNVRGAPETMLPLLTKIYQSGDANAKRSVLQVSFIYGAKAKDLVTDGLKDKDAGVRQQAIQSLQNLQGDLTEALPTILSLIKEKNPQINRQQLVWLLSRAGENGVPHLAELVKDADDNVRIQAIQVLRNLGPRAIKAAPALKEAVNDPNANIRLHAMLTLVSSGSVGTEFLVKHFNEEKDANTRSALLQNIAYSNERKHALPLLKVAMKDSSAQLRQISVNLIGVFGQQSEEGFEVFTMGLKDSDNQVRINAANHGNYFGQKSWGPFEDALKSAKDSNFRMAMLQGLQNTNYRSKTGVPALIDSLKDSNVTVRHLACNILGNIGPDASDALPRLRELAQGNLNQGVQNAARQAMQRIEPKDK